MENFTGLGVEAVRQDFYATVYLSGLESLLTGLAQEILEAKETQYPQKVNRAVSFNTIKTQAFILLMSDLNTDVILQRLTALFLQNPCLVRKNRNPPRKNSSANVLLNLKTAVEYSKIPFALSLSKGERGFGMLTKWVNVRKPFMLRQAQHERISHVLTAVFRLNYHKRMKKNNF